MLLNKKIAANTNPSTYIPGYAEFLKKMPMRPEQDCNSKFYERLIRKWTIQIWHDRIPEGFLVY